MCLNPGPQNWDIELPARQRPAPPHPDVIGLWSQQATPSRKGRAGRDLRPQDRTGDAGTEGVLWEW